MDSKNIILAILGLQITVLFGILSLIGQVGTVIWGEVMYMGIGVAVTAFAAISSRSTNDNK